MVRRSVQRLREVAATPASEVSPVTADYAASCALLLDAIVAVRGDAPDAPVRLARADSMMRTGPVHPVGEIGNALVARLWERHGAVDRALAAIRRRPYFFGRAANLGASLREEGRLAQRAGRDEEALAAYRHYLALRTEAEPEFAREIEGIRAEVQRLERKSAGN
jgi:hypothetical protein